MYRKIDNQRMLDIEASARYPDSFIIMSKDNMNTQMGTVLYVGDNEKELLDLLFKDDDMANCGIIEGLNHQKCIGGVVVNG